jgi:hypothetical protein
LAAELKTPEASLIRVELFNAAFTNLANVQCEEFNSVETNPSEKL